MAACLSLVFHTYINGSLGPPLNIVYRWFFFTCNVQNFPPPLLPLRRGERGSIHMLALCIGHAQAVLTLPLALPSCSCSCLAGRASSFSTCAS